MSTDVKERGINYMAVCRPEATEALEGQSLRKERVPGGRVSGHGSSALVVGAHVSNVEPHGKFFELCIHFNSNFSSQHIKDCSEIVNFEIWEMALFEKRSVFLN